MYTFHSRWGGTGQRYLKKKKNDRKKPSRQRTHPERVYVPRETAVGSLQRWRKIIKGKMEYLWVDVTVDAEWYVLFQITDRKVQPCVFQLQGFQRHSRNLEPGGASRQHQKLQETLSSSTFMTRLSRKLNDRCCWTSETFFFYKIKCC